MKNRLITLVFLHLANCHLQAQDLPSSPFGNWKIDQKGFPCFQYTMSEYTNSKANYNTSEGVKNDHLHVVGNEKITAFAYNHGWVEIFSGERGALWLNKYKFWENRFAGGYGFLEEGSNIYSLRYLDVPLLAKYDREFGIGYFQKTLSVNSLKVSQKVYAPNASTSTLISEVTITNSSNLQKTVTWNEYWDVSPKYIGDKIPDKKETDINQNFLYSTTLEGNVLVASTRAQNPPVTRSQRSRTDYYPPKFFLAPADINVQTTSFETKRSTAFNSSTGGFTGNLSNGLINNVLVKDANSCLIIGQTVTVPANRSVTIKFIVGYTFEESVNKEIALAREVMNSSWESLPRIELGDNGEYKAQEVEMIWHAYYLKALSSVDEYFKARMISQGGWYQYGVGAQMAARDPLQHILPSIYLDPALAKDVIKYTLQEMNPNEREGYIKYGVQGVGWLLDWDNQFTSDVMLFLFNAITDYINATKDYQFLSEVLSYYPKESGKTGTVIEHLKYAWNHQVKYVGTGPNGLIKLRDSDWDDIMHQLNCGDDVSCTEKSESVLNTAIATYVYPRLAKMIRKNGDQSWADEIDKTNEGLKAALRKQWNGKWFTRALINKGNSTKVIGSDQLHLAAQPWAILSNNLNTEEEQNLLNTIHSQLTGPLGARLVNDGS